MLKKKKMGIKAKKSMMKKVKKGSTELTAVRKDDAADFLVIFFNLFIFPCIYIHSHVYIINTFDIVVIFDIQGLVYQNIILIDLLVCMKQPLEGGPARKLPVTENAENKSTVLYIGRIPHGFYENEMEGNLFFQY